MITNEAMRKPKNFFIIIFSKTTFGTIYQTIDGTLYATPFHLLLFVSDQPFSSD